MHMLFLDRARVNAGEAPTTISSPMIFFLSFSLLPQAEVKAVECLSFTTYCPIFTVSNNYFFIPEQLSLRLENFLLAFSLLPSIFGDTSLEEDQLLTKIICGTIACSYYRIYQYLRLCYAYRQMPHMLCLNSNRWNSGLLHKP